MRTFSLAQMPSRRVLSLVGSLLVVFTVSCGGRPTIESFSLVSDATQVAPGDVVTIQTVQASSGALSRYATFSIVSGQAAGAIDIARGTATRFTASGAVKEVTTVVIQAVSEVDSTKSASLSLVVTPNAVRKVTVSVAQRELSPEGATQLEALVTGIGSFSPEVSWSIVSGGGALSATRGVSVRYSALGVAVGSSVELKATSVSDTAQSAVVRLEVTTAPKITAFESTAKSVGIGGGKTVLKWLASKGAKITLSPDIGAVTGTEKEVQVIQTTQFTLTATNALGFDSKTIEVSVENSGMPAWVRRVAEGGYVRANSTATDALGNVYTVGSVDVSLPGQAALGGRDAYLMKFNAAGQVLWTRQFGTAGDDSAVSVSVDAAGAVLVAGDTDQAFAGFTNAGLIDTYLAWFTAEGTKTRVVQFGTADYDYPQAMAIDRGGRAVLVGTTTGAFAGFANQGGTDSFLAAVDPSGAVTLLSQFGTERHEYPQGVAVDPQGFIVVVGSTDGAFPGYQYQGAGSGFVVRFSSAGVRGWLKQFLTVRNVSANALVVDQDGSVYVAGTAFGAFPGQVGSGENDLYLTKLDRDGTEQWLTQVGSAGDDYATALTLDSARNLYLGGNVRGTIDGSVYLGGTDAVIVKFSPQGQRLWSKQFGSAENEQLQSLAVDAAGSLFAWGVSAAAFAGVPSAGAGDAFLVKLQ